MEFKTVAEAFNYYKNFTVEQIERRAQEVKGIIETDPNVNITALNIELTGLNEAKNNAAEKEAGADPEARGAKLNFVTGDTFRMSSNTLVNGESDIYASKEYRSAFYKSLMGASLNAVERAALKTAIEAEKRADAYTTSGNTPVLIPTTTLNEIISKARNEGGVISIARGFNMPTKIAIPVATPSSKAIWNTEGAPVESVKPTIASVTFDAFEIIKVFSISAKVKAMSVDAFEAYLADELYKCVYECIADGLINGTGEGEGTGVLNGVTWTNENSVEVEAGGKIAFSDIVDAAALLKRGYGRGAKWVMNNSTLIKSIYGLTDDVGRPLFIADPKSENVGHIFGHEVVVDDFMPDDTIIYGDFKYLGYNLANGIAVESSRDSSFKSGRVDYRGMAIADTQVIVADAFIKLSIAAE